MPAGFGASWPPGANMIGYVTVTVPFDGLGKRSEAKPASTHRTTAGSGMSDPSERTPLTKPSSSITKRV